MSQLVVGFDVEFVAARAVGRKSPNTPRQLPNVIQVRLSEAPTSPQMRLVVFRTSVFSEDSSPIHTPR